FFVRRLLAFGRLRALPLIPRIRLCSELLLGERIGPVAERAFRELHDVALVHDREALALVRDRVLERRTDETLRALLRHGLDADSGRVREADLLVVLRECLLKQLEELLVLGRARLELD